MVNDDEDDAVSFVADLRYETLRRDAERYRALKAHLRVSWSEVRGGLALRVYHPTKVRHAREYQGVDLDHAIDLFLQDGEPVCSTPEQKDRYADYVALRGRP